MFAAVNMRGILLPIVPQFIISQHQACIYDTTLRGWNRSNYDPMTLKADPIGPFQRVMTQLAKCSAIL